LTISGYGIKLSNMKKLTFTLSSDGENLGSFTLDPYAQLCLMADARANKKLTLPQYVREAVREVTLRDDYPSTIHCRGDSGEEVAAISAELAAAN
jgi:hypothetical protein